jgi:Glycosyl transferase family 2
VHTERPNVTVLMCVFNGERFLRAAIDSILAQTYKDYEFVIVDDGSTDASMDIISSYRESRIRPMRIERNLGLAASLNQGLASSTGQYVARMDADDISLPHRLVQQVDFMERHPDIGICGSWIQVLHEQRRDVVRDPTDSDTIHARLPFDSAIAHPSVIVNRALWDRAGLSYDTSFPCAQDYELWSRAARTVRLANIPEVLLLRRLHPDQVGQKQLDEQQRWAGRVRRTHLGWLCIAPTDEEFSLHQAISTWNWPNTYEFASRSRAWLERLWAANQRAGAYPEHAFCKVLAGRWLAICQSVEPQIGRLFWSSPLSQWMDLGWRTNLIGRVCRGMAALRLV